MKLCKRIRQKIKEVGTFIDFQQNQLGALIAMRRMKAAEREVLVLDGQFALLESEKIAIESKLTLSNIILILQVKFPRTKSSKLSVLLRRRKKPWDNR